MTDNALSRYEKIRDLLTDSKFYQRTGTKKTIILLATTILLALLLAPKISLFKSTYREGDIAGHDIKAAEDTLIVDQKATALKVEQDVRQVKAIYDYVWRAAGELTNRLHDAFDLMREVYQDYGLTPEGQAVSGRAAAAAEEGEDQLQAVRAEVKTKLLERRKEFEDALRLTLSEDEFNQLLAAGFSGQVEEKIHALLGPVTGKKIVSNLELLEAEKDKGIIIKKIQLAGEINGGKDLALSHEVTEQLDSAAIGEIIELENARKTIKDNARQQLADLRSSLRDAIVSVASKLLTPNLTFNKQATEEAKAAAAEKVKPVLFQLKKGEVIVRAGERVTADDLPRIRALQEIQERFSWFWYVLGLFLLSASTLFVTHQFANKSVRKYSPSIRDLLFLGVLLVLTCLLSRIGLVVAEALAASLPYLPFSSYLYAIPAITVASVMAVRLVINSETALLYGVFASYMLGFQLDNNLGMVIYAFAGSVLGTAGVGQCTQRTQMLRSGLKVSLLNMLMVVAFTFSRNDPIGLTMLYDLIMAFSAGVGSGLLLTAITPLVEFSFGYLTDIKLLELSNLDNSLLRKLVMLAPGTYHHSMIIGTMVEEAAKAIGANPLLARVGAYYHDIGKMDKSRYFIENQSGKNPHDKLKPSLSAKIVARHVNEGIRMAKEVKLPQQLIDFIPQHHGTMMIGTFYEAAVAQADPEAGEISEEDFRYPGPKPQTREVALVMLADGIEASSRVLNEPTSARIQGMIQKRINTIFAAGQLEECPLTLKDLHLITRSFTHVLSSLFHNRIDYVEPVGKESNGRKKSDADSDKQPKSPTDSDEPDKKKNGESLKRLGSKGH